MSRQQSTNRSRTAKRIVWMPSAAILFSYARSWLPKRACLGLARATAQHRFALTDHDAQCPASMYRPATPCIQVEGSYNFWRRGHSRFEGIMRGIYIAIGLLVLGANVDTSFAAPSPGKRVALVVGNGAYQHIGRISNPTNDAEDVDRSASQARLRRDAQARR
jgi:hypothetical protein